MLRMNWDFVFVTDDKEGLDITYSRLKHLKTNDNIKYYNLSPVERYNLVTKCIKTYDTVCFIGDSLSDIKCLNISTISATTNNSPYEVKQYCDFISNLNGSDGALAELMFEIHNWMYNTKCDKIIQ